MASGFLHRKSEVKTAKWTAIWTPGVNLVNFYNLYDSKGDVTISTATSIASTLDGPIQVARYGALTVNAALSVTNRCRGLLILCDSLAMGAAGSITMTARGAAGNAGWVNQDILIPSAINVRGQDTSYRALIKWLAAGGYAVFDPTLWACPLPGMGDVQADYAAWPGKGTSMLAAASCGAGVAPATTATAVGATGGAGSNGGTGGGGSGGQQYASGNYGAASGPGRVWGGGPGAGGVRGGTYANAVDPTKGISADSYGGPGGAAVNTVDTYAVGGGAGNPGGVAAGTGGAVGGAGTGGVLLIICRGAVALTAGHVLSANGVAGGAGNAYGAGGGGSGGGSVLLAYGGTLTGTPNLTATGGAGGSAGSYGGGAGGAGATQVKTFAQMGWT